MHLGYVIRIHLILSSFACTLSCRNYLAISLLCKRADIVRWVGSMAYSKDDKYIYKSLQNCLLIFLLLYRDDVYVTFVDSIVVHVTNDRKGRE